ncbi:MAG: long-chain fatty acid--CoA ligase, partial [Acidimicrobiales bacterium]|nr:long-chain fatty acid--CoA ligase [Acidimicrobiales bacterium]
AITAGTNPRLRPSERAAVIETAAPKLVIAAEDHVAGIPDDQEVELIRLADAPDTILGELRLPGQVPVAMPADLDRPVCICFSSGSTGDPKGALFANRQLAAIAELDTGGAWGGGGHRIAPTEFAHIGIMTKLPWLLAAGGTTHLLTKWRAADVVDLIDRHRISAVTGVAPQIALMLRVEGIEERDFSCVKAVVVGGSASPPALVREARRIFGAPYLIRYSSTECGGVGLGTSPEADDEEALHTIGRPRPGIEATVRGPDGHLVPDGETGELWLRSRAIMSEYWRAPEATAETLVDGWLRTGDLATIDDRGLFRLTGRIKEMFIRGGYNVYPAEIERVLTDHPAVAEVAVVPRPDDVMGEIGVAVLGVRPGVAAPTLDDLRAFAADRLAGYKLPEAIRVLDQLPRNGTDKVDRRMLVEHETAT